MSEARTLPAWPYPRAIAHRGAGKLAPENTLAAFRHGASFGYRMFEFDVKLSGDGVAVLLHDATLERTTSGHGRIDALSFSQIAQLDAGSWHSPAFAGEPVPTLAAVARYLRANGFLANIEIKPVPGTEWRTGAAVALDASTLGPAPGCRRCCRRSRRRRWPPRARPRRNCRARCCWTPCRRTGWTGCARWTAWRSMPTIAP
ncbi:hypothetical protein ACEQUB_01970 [Ralstonia syzygii]